MKKLVLGVVIGLVVGIGGLGTAYYLLNRPPDEIETVTGKAVDADTGNPVEGVQIQVGELSARTDVDGSFRLTAVTPGKLTATHCAYEEATETLRVGEVPTVDVDLKLAPRAIEGRATSNLDEKGIKATLASERLKEPVQTEESGRFRVAAVCDGDKLTVESDGYESQSVEVVGAGPLDVELLAGAGKTLEKEVEWEQHGKLRKIARLAHPDTKAYVTKEEIIQGYRDGLLQGYQTVSLDVKEVKIIKWVFPKCPLADFGPKTYPKTAAVRARWHTAEPRGDSSTEIRVTHYVQTKDGLWRWFPNNGCEY